MDVRPIEEMCGYCKHFETPPKCKLDGEETEITFGCSYHEPIDNNNKPRGDVQELLRQVIE